MLTSVEERAVLRDDRPAYRPFEVVVARVESIAPGFVRVTFTGDQLAYFGTAGLDQRIKLVFPLPGTGWGDPDFLSGDPVGWYARWRELPEERRNPFRTYTVRRIDQSARELDVDFAVHVGEGPAVQWLAQARPGDRIAIVGPDDRSEGYRLGLDWHPGEATSVLLVGDETAVPAVGGILEALPESTVARVLLEVPDDGFPIDLPTRADARITWLTRDGGPHGSRLEPALRGWLASDRAAYAPALGARQQPVEEIDVDAEILWDSPEDGPGAFYAWLAGESAAIKALRRVLVTETGIDRKRVAFMGYWRLGVAERTG
ncbi:siderophore-interacting protein [Arenivirga flava]|uniref:siderophore-interacting protein n=1 Tax=Arenivirga flava TaxID=1930060 RepID=UPI0024E14D86|nr:siderophore-interacting protein [Arenivirga flava]